MDIAMKHEIITRATGTPDWGKLPVIAIDTKTKPCAAEVRASAQICYDDTALYLHLSAEETDVRAEVTDPMGQTCEDSCLEFFFRPDPDDMRYFNIEFNLNCCPFIGFGSCFEDLIRLHPLTDRFSPCAKKTGNGWEIAYSVPFSFIREFFPAFSPNSGKVIRANFYKCGDKTAVPHYYSWEMPANRPHGFHCPECFGVLEFE